MKTDQTYQNHGIQFSYPEHWELFEEKRDDALTLTVADDGVFWSVTILEHRPRARHVLDEATRAFREEYNEVDEYAVDARIGEAAAEGKNLEFVSLELINCVFLRAREEGGRTLFVMAQVPDHERENYEEIFETINASLACDPDDQILIS